ncbi:MAG TPA: RNA polymerase sigma factor SigM [Nocardioides sp.]|uniref:RNA polymerase sigma factor SigM n=1 Tax=Nocardioides sp. TaxID=35761 RepID=UPI002E3611FD|nr:RNA polymerase sigma factor SigM [Nocardioides sp.]HEX3930337.1 RNA polymerase sigma factor SigM [Nocardioides sp.]
MSEEASDAELLAAHVAGDPDAFGLLFARHRDRLWAVALRTMGNPHDAADGLQDALVSAYRRAGSFRGDAAVTTWLHRVVVNACLDRIRAAKVRRAEPLPDDLDEQSGRGSVAAAAGAHDDPEAAAVAADRRRALLAALAVLPAEQRAALVLVDMEGHSVAEVAAMLECAEGTVKSRCSRGRERLAQLLRARLADGDATPGHPAHQEPASGSARPTRVAPDAPPGVIPGDRPAHADEGGVP